MAFPDGVRQEADALDHGFPLFRGNEFENPAEIGIENRLDVIEQLPSLIRERDGDIAPIFFIGHPVDQSEKNKALDQSAESACIESEMRSQLDKGNLPSISDFQKSMALGEGQTATTGISAERAVDFPIQKPKFFPEIADFLNVHGF